MTRTRVVVIAVSGAVHRIRKRRARTNTHTRRMGGSSVDEYRALRARAVPEPSSPAAPPVEATLTRIDYDCGSKATPIAGRALLTIDVLRDGWTRVQIPAGLMVRDARIDGQPLSLIEGPPPHVLLSRAGRVVLTLEIVIPLAASAGTESISLPASAAPICAPPDPAENRRRPVGVGRFRRRAGRGAQRKPMDGVRRARTRRCASRGSARSTIAAPNCRCGFARVSPPSSALAKKSRWSRRRFASKCCRASPAKCRSRSRPGSSSTR